MAETWWHTVLCVIVVTVLLKLRRASSRRDVAGLNLPPGPWTLPVIGSLYCLVGALARLARWYGAVKLLRLGHVRTLVVSSPEAAREVMKTHDAALANRPVYVTMDIFTNGGQNIAMSPYTSTHWRELRRLCSAPDASSRERQRQGEAHDERHHHEGHPWRQREAYLDEMANALELLAGFNLVDLFPTSRLARVIGGRSLRVAREVHARIDRIMKAIIQSHAKAMDDKMARRQRGPSPHSAASPEGRWTQDTA
ncbi:hypothetical protein EJB05_18826, partial [Eragrostis curvula]